MIYPNNGYLNNSADIGLKDETSVYKSGNGGAQPSAREGKAGNMFSSIYEKNTTNGGFKGPSGGTGGVVLGQSHPMFSELFSLGRSEKTTGAQVAQGVKNGAVSGGHGPDERSVVNDLNLDSLGAVVNKPVDYPGYEKTDYGYIQTDPTQKGADYLLLVEDPMKMTDQQTHYMRNIDMANLIRKGKIPTDLDKFTESETQAYALLPERKSKFHMNGENGGYNVKLVNSQELHGYGPGELEVVYNTNTGKLDLSAENMPTLNLDGPDKKYKHTVKDVLPYYVYGNTPHDETAGIGRITGPLIPDQSDSDKKAVYDNTRKDLGEPPFEVVGLGEVGLEP